MIKYLKKAWANRSGDGHCLYLYAYWRAFYQFYFHEVEPRTDFKFLSVHHYFTGYLLSLVGFWSLFHWYGIVAQSLIILGLWITADDWIQHTIQRQEIKGWGLYTTVSFWHWFPYWVLDKIRGKK